MATSFERRNMKEEVLTIENISNSNTKDMLFLYESHKIQS